MVECAILNTFQARWQYGAEAIGAGFAQGKNMMWRREVLDRAGGIRALASEIAEDAASTKVIRAQGMDVRLVDMPFEQPLGQRTAREVYSRHVRWARLRRATFPAHYAPEFMNGSFAAIVLGAYAALQFDGGISTVALAHDGLIVSSLHGGEIWLARVCGFPLDWRTPFALIVRDLMLPVMFIDALLYDDFVWHGAEMTRARGRGDDGLGGVDSKDSLLGANQIQGCFWGGSLGCDGSFGFERRGVGADGAADHRSTRPEGLDRARQPDVRGRRAVDRAYGLSLA